MTNMVDLQRSFMEAAGQTTDEYFNLEQKDLYEQLCWEEANELYNASGRNPDKPEEFLECLLKEAADNLVVTLGLVISMGVDPDELFTLVHNNNMLKVTGEMVKDSSGKVIKSQASIDAKKQLLADIRALLKPEVIQ